MLGLALIARCALGLIIMTIIALFTTLRQKKKLNISFNMWQGAIAAAGLCVYLHTVLQNSFPLAYTYVLSIPIDIMVYVAIKTLICKMSISTKIAQQQTAGFVQTYLIAKMLLCTAIHLVFAIMQISQSLYGDMREELTKLLWIYEMPISVDDYLANVIWAAYNTKYSFEIILQMTILFCLNSISISSLCQIYYKMSKTYKAFVVAIILIMVAQYVKEGLTVLFTDSLPLLSIALIGTLVIWWWFNEKSTHSHKILEKI